MSSVSGSASSQSGQFGSSRPGPPRPGDLYLTKLHGLGNDFLVTLDPSPDQVGPELARQVCDRHTGIGADGLIVGRGLDGAGRGLDGASPPARLTFQLWNADGSDAEMSGNGIRCLAHAALDAGWVDAGETFGVLTAAGCRQVTIRRAEHPNLTWATVDMGTGKVGGEADRCNIGHGQLLVDLGNPHLVVLGPDPATVDVATLGPALEATETSGLNVEFVTLGPGPDVITMRVWERGVGETEACGTGACAAAVALHHWGRVGSAVTVLQPGGPAAVEIQPDGTVTLAGPSEYIADCWVRICA
jgi:diaminopimelate epimerase